MLVWERRARFDDSQDDVMCHSLTRVLVHTVGRTRDRGWETLAASEYERRLARGKPPVLARTIFHPTADALVSAAERLAGDVWVLDRTGRQMSSEDFAETLRQRLVGTDSDAASVVFVIGGAEGLPQIHFQHATEIVYISLRQMTLPHRLARLLLLEQLFRAREIWAKSSYHKR